MICVHCNDEAMMRCKTHKAPLCGEIYCVGLHRWGGGDCDFYPVEPGEREPVDWIDIMLGLGGLTVAIVFAGVVFAHLGRIQ